MFQPRSCGCKGCRTCIICENYYGVNTKTFELNKDNGTYVYCPFCKKAWPGWDIDEFKNHPHHVGEPLDFRGVYIDLNFLTADEETLLIQGVDKMPWDLSQSGRRKQNFGPKCNFKKNKLKLGEFNGFPQFSEFVQQKFREEVSVLKNFQTIEQCSLEYDPERGASIDPHIDDCWIWGERIISVNLLSDTALTMTYNIHPERYNLHLVSQYPSILNNKCEFNNEGDIFKVEFMKNHRTYPIVRIPMPRRSLLVLFGDARYNWEHRILREDILDRRICLAYREFTPPYLPNGEKCRESADIYKNAKKFI